MRSFHRCMALFVNLILAMYFEYIIKKIEVNTKVKIAKEIESIKSFKAV